MPLRQEHRSLRSRMLFTRVDPMRKNSCLMTWPCSCGFMLCCSMLVWNTSSCCRMEVTLNGSDPLWSSPSSYTLLERLRKPVGFMLEIPWRLSCSNIPGTVRRESGLTRRRKGKCIITYPLYFHTDHGKERVLHHADELMVDVDGEVAENLPVLWKVEVLQAVLVLARSVVLHELLLMEGKWTIHFRNDTVRYLWKCWRTESGRRKSMLWGI